MRVLITAGIFPPDIGGPATFVPHIAAALAERGHAVTVVAPQEPGVPCPIAEPPYRLVRFPRAHVLRYANYFIEFRRAVAAIYREARTCDVLFVNGLDAPATLVSRALGKPLVVKVVGDGAWELAHNRGWTTRNLVEFQQVHGPRIGLFRAIRHAAAKRAEAVIAPSRYLAHIVMGWGVAGERIHVVYNAPIAPAATEDFSLPSHFAAGFRLLMVGRMIPLKRMEQVIGILPHLSAARLVIVGDGPLYAALSAQVARSKLESQVLFTGRIAHAGVWSLLRRYADVLVLNSIHETFPHILVEAAMCGVPVVATAVGGTPEIVQDGETGLLIPPDSPDDLRAALCRLQNDADLRHRLSVNAQRAAARFSFERMVEETERVLDQIGRSWRGADVTGGEA